MHIACLTSVPEVNGCKIGSGDFDWAIKRSKMLTYLATMEYRQPRGTTCLELCGCYGSSKFSVCICCKKTNNSKH
jgi:hypothetical protein